MRVMLVTLAILLPGSMFAQNVTLELKNVTVQEAVTQLQSQGNYTIVINSGDVDLQKRVSVSAKNASLNDVLTQIFSGQKVDFSVNGNTVSVNRQKNVAAPAKKVFSGKVLDENGEPLMGASVLVKESGQFATTDIDGKFSLEDLKFPASITVFFLGYDDYTVTLDGNETFPYTISMKGQNLLDEIVVVGYGTQKRVNLTGAVSVIDGKELNARPVTNTAMAIRVRTLPLSLPIPAVPSMVPTTA